MKTTSVIITTYRRYDTLLEVIDGWLLNNPDQLWVIDNGGGYKVESKHYGKVNIFNMPIDLTTRVDYAFAMLTDGDFVCLADDDAVPKPGLLKDFYDGWHEVGGGIVGPIGRTFHGVRYKQDTHHYRSTKISKPVRTGSLGVMYFSPRQYLGFDTRGMETIDDDLYWLMNIHPTVPKHVIPTKNYYDLPTCNDDKCLFHAPVEQRNIRDAKYKEYYLKNYAPYGKIY